MYLISAQCTFREIEVVSKCIKLFAITINQPKYNQQRGSAYGLCAKEPFEERGG
jgi:hypothetical protein